MVFFPRRVPRNAALLAALLLLLVAGPVAPARETWFIGEVTFDLILLAGVYTVGPNRHRWPFIILTAITLAARWGELLSGVSGLDIGALSLTAIWLSYAVWIIVQNLFQRTDVTIDTILGAIVTYLLAASAFSQVFQILELTSPGSFTGLPDNVLAKRHALSDAMLYFSFVCITTMGFGDIVPVSDIARPLVVVEGVFGQMYLAVMIARLVGLHIARQPRSGD